MFLELARVQTANGRRPPYPSPSSIGHCRARSPALCPDFVPAPCALLPQEPATSDGALLCREVDCCHGPSRFPSLLLSGFLPPPHLPRLVEGLAVPALKPAGSHQSLLHPLHVAVFGCSVCLRFTVDKPTAEDQQYQIVSLQ